MIKSYLRHAWRAIAYNRRYMLISMVGLVLSLAGTIVIARYLHRELTVNQYIPDLDRTMVGYDIHDGAKWRTNMINFNNIPTYVQPNTDKDVEKYTQFLTFENSYVTSGDAEMAMNVVVSDTAFLDIFPRVLHSGQFPKNEFEAVVTEEAAARLWPGGNPISQKVSMYSDRNLYTVTGVVESLPTKGHFDFDVLLVRDQRGYYSRYTGWAVCRLRPMASVDSVNARTERAEAAIPKEGRLTTSGTRLMPLADLYFDSTFDRLGDDPLNPLGNKHNLQILQIVAWLLLLIGLFNFLNIYSIVMITRSPAFGVRKVFGAGRQSIFMHILAENLIVIAIAVLLAWIIVAAVSPLLSNYFEIEQVAMPKFDIILSVGIVIVFSLIVSAVSALSIWRNAKVHSMGNSDSRHAIVLRRYLLLMPQMALTLIMITLSVYFMRQLHHMLTADVGFARENILSFKLMPEQGREKAYPVFNAEYTFEDMRREADHLSDINNIAISKINEMPEVIAVASWYSHDMPTLTYMKGNTMSMQKAGDPDNQWVSTIILYLSREAMDVFQIDVNDGRWFEEYGDERDGYQYEMLASRSLLDRLGITDFRSERVQVKDRVWYSVGYDTSTNPPYEVIGVIDNLRINPLSEESMPATIHYSRGSREGKPIIRYNPESKDALLAKLTALYQELNGKDIEPEFEFSEDINAQVYAKERLTAHFYATFTALAIFISCLGLYGVMAYDMQRRRREFMIRRVQGARSADLVKLATKPYATTLGISAIIAAACSLYVIMRYQSHYYDCVGMQPWGFIVGLALIAVIGYATIRRQVEKSSTLRNDRD